MVSRFFYLLAVAFAMSPSFTNGQTIPLNKNAGVVFRFDDYQSMAKLDDLRTLFGKYGKKFVYSTNMRVGEEMADNTFFQAIKRLQDEGHEIGEHTPNHFIQFFTTQASNEAKSYESKPGVNHVINNKVCLSYFLNNPNGAGDAGKVDIYNNYMVSYSPGAFSWNQLYGSTYYPSFYLPDLDIVLTYTDVKNLNSSDPDTAYFKTFWMEDIDLGNKFNYTYRKLSQHDITMDPNGLKLLTQYSMDLFHKHNLNAPTTFNIPEGSFPSPVIEAVKSEIFEPFGFESGSINPYSLKCVNEANPYGNNKFGLQQGDFSQEYMNLSEVKRIIADRYARHFASIGIEHLNPYKFGGDWNLLYAQIDSLLQWCVENDIEVETNSSLSNKLYNSITNPLENVIPLIQVDKNKDGYPDGFSYEVNTLDLSSGVAESENKSFSRSTNGVICNISKLAGIEQGLNRLSLYAKGLDPIDNITIIVDFPENLYSNMFVIEDTSSDYKKHSFDFYVPENVSYVNIYFALNTYSNKQVNISGMELRAATNKPKIKSFKVSKDVIGAFPRIDLNNQFFDPVFSASEISWKVISYNDVRFMAGVSGDPKLLIQPNDRFWVGLDSLKITATNPLGLVDTATILIESTLPRFCAGQPVTLQVPYQLGDLSYNWEITPFDTSLRGQSTGIVNFNIQTATNVKLSVLKADSSTSDFNILLPVAQTRMLISNVLDLYFGSNTQVSHNFDLTNGYHAYLFNEPYNHVEFDGKTADIYKMPSFSGSEDVLFYVHNQTCDATIQTLKVNSFTTGISEIKATNKMYSVWPNPSSESLNIKLNDNANSQSKLLLYDINGRMLMKFDFNDETSFSISELTNGVYLLQIMNYDQTEFHKIVKY